MDWFPTRCNTQNTRWTIPCVLLFDWISHKIQSREMKSLIWEANKSKWYLIFTEIMHMNPFCNFCTFYHLKIINFMCTAIYPLNSLFVRKNCETIEKSKYKRWNNNTSAFDGWTRRIHSNPKMIVKLCCRKSMHANPVYGYINTHTCHIIKENETFCFGFIDV